MKYIFIAALFAYVISATSASAKQVCGWYAIAACTTSFSDANQFMSKGWGYVINTNDFAGLKRGYYCVVSGPQSKSSAERDRRQATADRVAQGMYIKRACVDESRYAE